MAPEDSWHQGGGQLGWRWRKGLEKKRENCLAGDGHTPVYSCLYIYVMIIMYITVYVDDLYNYNLKGMVSYS
jgi:hypothetical protein